MRRDSKPGFFVSGVLPVWIAHLHSDTLIPCVDREDTQCAGAAIYRMNICRPPGVEGLLVLPANRKDVFELPTEFVNHHTLKELP